MCPFKTVSITEYNLSCDLEDGSIFLYNLVDWRIYLMGFITEELLVGIFCCCSVTKSCLTLQPHALQQARFLRSPLSPRVCSDSCPLIPWCCLTTSSSAALFSFCLQSLPASGYYPISWLYASSGQSTVASASVLSMNIQVWFPLGLIGLISLQSNGFSIVFSSTTIWKHQFTSAQLSLWSNSHIHTWLIEKL